MAIIVDEASNIVIKRVAVDPWWACTPEFNSTIKTIGTTKISTPFIVGSVSASNDETEPPYTLPCYVVDRTPRAEGVTEFSVYSDTSVITTRLRDIAPEGTLTRKGSEFSLTGSSLYSLETFSTAYGKQYKLPFFNFNGEVPILVNGVAVTGGTDADGNTITEASYLEDGQSWTMDLAANLPDVTILEAATPYVWMQGGRLIFDPTAYTGWSLYHDLFGENKTQLFDGFFFATIVPLSYSVMGCACAEDIEIGEPLYANKAGYVAYKEGWTDPLMAFKRDTGTAAATIVTIGVNGMATTGNYLDDEGKPYTGLVYKTRPEPTQSPAFVEQFALLQVLRKVKFTSVQNLDWNTQLAIEDGVCWILKKTRNGSKYSYEGVYCQGASPGGGGTLLTPSTMIFPLYGGTKGVAYYGDDASLIESGDNDWGDYTPSLTSNGIVTTGYLTFTPNCLTIARNLNIRAQYVDDPDKVLMGIAAPICETTTTTLKLRPEIKATAYGAAMNATTYTTKIIDASEGVTYIEIKVGTISATAPQSAIYWFAWAPRYYDSSTATPSVSVMFGPPYNQGITQKLAWDHCFAVVFVPTGTEITREDITPSDTDTYQSYTLWKVPIGMAQLGGRVTTFLVRLNFDSTKGTTGIVGEQFRIGFGSMSPLPYSE